MRMPMIARTTNRSIRVKPRRLVIPRLDTRERDCVGRIPIRPGLAGGLEIRPTEYDSLLQPEVIRSFRWFRDNLDTQARLLRIAVHRRKKRLPLLVLLAGLGSLADDNCDFVPAARRSGRVAREQLVTAVRVEIAHRDLPRAVALGGIGVKPDLAELRRAQAQRLIAHRDRAGDGDGAAHVVRIAPATRDDEKATSQRMGATHDGAFLRPRLIRRPGQGAGQAALAALDASPACVPLETTRFPPDRPPRAHLETTLQQGRETTPGATRPSSRAGSGSGTATPAARGRPTIL